MFLRNALEHNVNGVLYKYVLLLSIGMSCGYALALTNPTTCCFAGRCLQAMARRSELRNQTTLS